MGGKFKSVISQGNIAYLGVGETQADADIDSVQVALCHLEPSEVYMLLGETVHPITPAPTYSSIVCLDELQTPPEVYVAIENIMIDLDDIPLP